MVNLVFPHAIQDPVLVSVVAYLPPRYHILPRPGTLEIGCCRCPTIIQMIWVYLVDVLSFIMNHLAEVQTALHFADEEQIPQSYDFADIVLLPKTSRSTFSCLSQRARTLIIRDIPAWPLSISDSTTATYNIPSPTKLLNQP
jgi:hypothetical protein